MSGGVTAPRILFVTGTDTGVGKTCVSVALLAALRRRGVSVPAIKAIETGCAPDREPEDAARLAAAAGRQLVCLQRFELPVAPEAAARARGETIQTRPLVESCLEHAWPCGLVEGAGGLLVPIAPSFTMASLASALAARVLIVARTRLGTINHTLLTLAECRRQQLDVIGVVLNRTDEIVGPEEAENARLIAAHGRVRIFGPLPHRPAATVDEWADLAEAHLPVVELLEWLSGPVLKRYASSNSLQKSTSRPGSS